MMIKDRLTLLLRQSDKCKPKTNIILDKDSQIHDSYKYIKFDVKRNIQEDRRAEISLFQLLEPFIEGCLNFLFYFIRFSRHGNVKVCSNIIGVEQRDLCSPGEDYGGRGGQRAKRIISQSDAGLSCEFTVNCVWH